MGGFKIFLHFQAIKMGKNSKWCSNSLITTTIIRMISATTSTSSHSQPTTMPCLQTKTISLSSTQGRVRGQVPEEGPPTAILQMFSQALEEVPIREDSRVYQLRELQRNTTIIVNRREG
jgi:hypothetical protein